MSFPIPIPNIDPRGSNDNSNPEYDEEFYSEE